MTGLPQPDDPAAPAFRHGVASGDPLADRVVIWTRFTPAGRASSPAVIGLRWEMARDTAFADIVASGEAEAAEDHDYTANVDVAGLEPATRYHYRFTAPSGEVSPPGRTRTAPEPDAKVPSLRIGVASCAAWANGYFNAYRNLAARDLDLIVHVGDYIYEGSHRAGRPVRPVPRPDPVFRLDDYRRRYALYRTDPDVQALHARHPIAAVWDDHEISSGAWRDGASGHAPRRHGPWSERRRAAVSAYFDWMPMRAPEQTEPDRIYRALGWGALADLFLIDTRLVGRDQPAGDGSIRIRPGRHDRALLGEAQRQWLAAAVHERRPHWRIVANQVMMAPAGVLAGRIINPDQWDGYPDERRWLYDLFGTTDDGTGPGSQGGGGNVVVLSGDLHSSWVADLPIGAEFLTPSVTARSFAGSLLPWPRLAPLAARIFLRQNHHLRMVDLRRHGYVVVDLDAERAHADFWHVETIHRRSAVEGWAGGWQLRHGRPGLVPANAPLGRRA